MTGKNADMHDIKFNLMLNLKYAFVEFIIELFWNRGKRLLHLFVCLVSNLLSSGSHSPWKFVDMIEEFYRRFHYLDY